MYICDGGGGGEGEVWRLGLEGNQEITEPPRVHVLIYITMYNESGIKVMPVMTGLAIP